MMMKTEYRKMNRILGAILLCLITSGQRQIIANEQQESIRLDWKKDTRSSFWTAEVNRFDVPSGAVVEVKGPKAGLIRVTGDQPALIRGTLISSNPIYVISPHGVVVGPKGKINGIFGIPALDMQISSYTSKGHETGPVCYHSTSNSDLITFLTDEQREEIESSLYKTIKEYIWLGDIRIGGLTHTKETKPPSSKGIQNEDEIIKTQGTASQLETINGEHSGFLEMYEVEGSIPSDSSLIPIRVSRKALFPGCEKD